jgi:tRNA U34 2-thiouridine synthase MnmA/TrmU
LSRGKGIVLISGGLDSLLAARLLMDQDLDMIGFYGALPFVAPDADPASLKPVQLAAQINLTVHVHRCGREYIDILRNPSHGYGKHMNPCIDCHIYFIKKAAEMMRDCRADFVATGEVVGQRPMSQMRHTMNHIEKETGLKGRLLRPLSAQLLKPTIPEEEGIVNRDLLMGINGRSRKDQFELARKYNIAEYESPSGGCLFTDRFISRRVSDLLTHGGDVDTVDFYLLTIGRHYRISEAAKIIVSRNERENSELEKYRMVSDYLCLPDFKGPAVYVKGAITESDMALIGSIMLRYGKVGDGVPAISIRARDGRVTRIIAENAISDEDLERLRI